MGALAAMVGSSCVEEMPKNAYLCIKMWSKLKYWIADNRGYCLTMLVAVAVFGAFNVLTTLKPDDLHFAMIAGSDDKVLIAGWHDLWTSWSTISVSDNGRLANYITQFFSAMAGKSWFNVANVVVFALFLHFTGLCITSRQRVPAVVALLTCVMVLLVIPYPGETMLWMCGSLNYLWSATLSVIVIAVVTLPWPWRCGWLQVVAFCLLAFVAGWMQESASYPVSFGWLAWMLARRRRPRAGELAALACYVLGAVLITCSPAAWQRLADAGVGGDGSIAATILRHCRVIVLRSVRYGMPVLALLVIVATWLKKGGKTVVADCWNWIWVGNVILLFILADPHKQRLYFFYVLTSYVVVARWLYVLLAERHSPMRWATVALAVATVWPAGAAFKALAGYKRGYDHVEALIAASPASCVLRSYDPPYNRWIATNHFDSASFFDYNTLFCRYYGKSSLVFLRPALYERYHRADFLAGGTLAPFASSCPQLASRIYVFRGQDYSILPVDSACIDTRYESRHMELDRQLAQPNSLTYFWLKQRGRFYMIIPPVEADVTRLEIPLLDGGRPVKVVMTRQNR